MVLIPIFEEKCSILQQSIGYSLALFNEKNGLNKNKSSTPQNLFRIIYTTLPIGYTMFTSHIEQAKNSLNVDISIYSVKKDGLTILETRDSKLAFWLTELFNQRLKENPKLWSDMGLT